MVNRFFVLAIALTFGVALVVAAGGDDARKSTTEKKDAKGCCMQGAKAEKASKDEASKDVAETSHVKHVGHQHEHGDVANAKDKCDTGDDCCEGKSAETTVEKKDEKKPLR